MTIKEPGAAAPVVLSAFAFKDTATLDILAPGGSKSIGWRITFAGPGHPKTIAFNEAKNREILHRNRQIEAAQINGRKYKPEEQTVEEARRENVRWVAARIVEWTPVALSPDKPPLAFSEAAAIEIFINPDLGWIYAQCLDFLAADQSFTQTSAKA